MMLSTRPFKMSPDTSLGWNCPSSCVVVHQHAGQSAFKFLGSKLRGGTIFVWLSSQIGQKIFGATLITDLMLVYWRPSSAQSCALFSWCRKSLGRGGASESQQEQRGRVYVLQFKFGKINSFFQFSRLPIVTRLHFLMLSFMMAGCGIENELCHAACISSLSSCLLLVCRVNLPRWICMCYIRTFTFLVDRSGYWFCSQNGDLTWYMCGILCSGPQPQPFMEVSLGL